MGTVPYMAPEQLEGKETDARTDLFAFGCVLYEMLTARRAFGGDTEASVISAIMTGEPAPLSDAAPVDTAGARPPRAPLPGEGPRRPLADRGRRGRGAARRFAGRGRRDGPWRPPVAFRGAGCVLDGCAHAIGNDASLGSGCPMSVVGVVGAVMFVLWYQGRQPALSFTARDWILVSDFENLTGDSIFDKSLGTALNVSLSQSTYANVFSKARTITVLQRMGKKPDTPVDEQVGREVCPRENIRGLICPGIGKVGNTFVVTAGIVDPQTGDGVRSYTERADDYNHILPALDAVAASLRKGLGESLAQVQSSSRPLAKVKARIRCTALKSYSEAQQLWGNGRSKAALDLDESAVKEDPDFAMAHAALGVYYPSFVFGDSVKAKAHFEKSLSLAGRTTDREKMAIRLHFCKPIRDP